MNRPLRRSAYRPTYLSAGRLNKQPPLRGRVAAFSPLDIIHPQRAPACKRPAPPAAHYKATTKVAEKPVKPSVNQAPRPEQLQRPGPETFSIWKRFNYPRIWLIAIAALISLVTAIVNSSHF